MSSIGSGNFSTYWQNKNWNNCAGSSSSGDANCSPWQLSAITNQTNNLESLISNYINDNPASSASSSDSSTSSNSSALSGTLSQLESLLSSLLSGIIPPSTCSGTQTCSNTSSDSTDTTQSNTSDSTDTSSTSSTASDNMFAHHRHRHHHHRRLNNAVASGLNFAEQDAGNITNDGSGNCTIDTQDALNFFNVMKPGNGQSSSTANSSTSSLSANLMQREINTINRDLSNPQITQDQTQGYENELGLLNGFMSLAQQNNSNVVKASDITNASQNGVFSFQLSNTSTTNQTNSNTSTSSDTSDVIQTNSNTSTNTDDATALANLLTLLQNAGG